MISFLKEIFLPTKIKNYFLFQKTFACIEISENIIKIAKVSVVGTKINIITLLTKEISKPEEPTMLSKIIEETLKEIGYYDELIVILPNKNIIFKELTVPFTSREQIREILPFEVEPLIPFTREQAVIEFIQTNIIYETNQSNIIISIIQQSTIDLMISLFAEINIFPDKIVPKAFAIWALYTSTNTIIAPSHMILCIEDKFITISLFINTQLRLVRVLPYGLIKIFESITTSTTLSLKEITHFLEQNNIAQDTNEHIAYKEGIKKLKNDLLFTCQSIPMQKNDLCLTIILNEKKFPLLETMIAQEISSTLHPIPLELILHNLQINTSTQKCDDSFFAPLGGAIPITLIEQVNFLREKENKISYNLFIKQSVTAIILIIGIVSFLFFSYKNTLNVLRNEISDSEKEVIEILRTELNVPNEETRFDDVVDYAEKEAKNKQRMWLAFSNQARTSLLQYLLELTERINKDALGFSIERLTFDQNKIILKAEVRDYEALKVLERELRQSKLFSYIEPQDNPRFTMTINLIPLGEE